MKISGALSMVLVAVLFASRDIAAEGTIDDVTPGTPGSTGSADSDIQTNGCSAPSGRPCLSRDTINAGNNDMMKKYIKKGNPCFQEQPGGQGFCYTTMDATPRKERCDCDNPDCGCTDKIQPPPRAEAPFDPTVPCQSKVAGWTNQCYSKDQLDLEVSERTKSVFWSGNPCFYVGAHGGQWKCYTSSDGSTTGPCNCDVFECNCLDETAKCASMNGEECKKNQCIPTTYGHSGYTCDYGEGRGQCDCTTKPQCCETKTQE